jgi:hypothetical protein
MSKEDMRSMVRIAQSQALDQWIWAWEEALHLERYKYIILLLVSRFYPIPEVPYLYGSFRRFEYMLSLYFCSSLVNCSTV